MSVDNSSMIREKTVPQDRPSADKWPTLSAFRLTRTNAFLLMIHTGLISCLLGVLIANPDVVVGLLSKLGIRSFEQVSETKNQFFLDISILWTIGFVFIMLDAVSRNSMDSPLIKTSFFTRRSEQSVTSRILLAATFISSFIFAPALVVIHLGQNSLNTHRFIVEDGPLENMATIGFAIATVLVAKAGFRMLRHRSQAPKWHGVFFVILALCMLLVVMEEISWGQRVFGWETPAGLREMNLQGELNLHNIFTDYFEVSYLILGSLLFSATSLSCWLSLTKSRLGKIGQISGILPDRSLMFLSALVLLFSSHITINELVEELATLVLVLYSVWVLIRLRGIPSSADITLNY